MYRNRPHTLKVGLCVVLAVLLVVLTPSAVLAYGGESHKHAAWEGTALFTPFMRDTVSPDEPLIMRNPTFPLFPALESDSTFWEYGWEEGVDENGDDVSIVPSSNRYWIYWGSKREDDYDSEYSYAEVFEKTVSHFWDLDHGVLHQPGSAYYNAWMKAEEMWAHSMDAWYAGDDGKAYFYLGKAIHLLVDQGQPAHPHGDLHPDYDSLEEWSGKADAEKFSWYQEGKIDPGPVLWAPSAGDVLDDIYAHPEIWQDDMTSFTHDDCPNGAFVDELTNPLSQHRVQELFYLMSYVNQTADFCASDDFPGDDLDYLGWVDFTQLDQSLPTLDLSDNGRDECDLDDDRDHSTCKSDMCNADGDLWRIYSTAYTTGMRAVPGAINSWRRTLDSDPPSSTVELTRTDGKPMAEWNNSPITAHITGAVDEDPFHRASGVWKVWGELDGVAPANPDDPSWGVATEGVHELACLSTDMFGNVERHDITMMIDLTPPEITFPDLRPNYLTSQAFLASWETTDALSGVDDSTAYLDGELVDNGTLIDLALKAGTHRLEVYATDVAGNMAYETYGFEVWIDATAYSKPLKLNDKTNGAGMYVDIEFPAPYDVRSIHLPSARLSVLAGIDLTEESPIQEATAVLEGTNLSGVGDHDADGVADRGVKFDKALFAAALCGQTGDVSSVTWGCLASPDGPRYLAVVTNPVFAAPK